MRDLLEKIVKNSDADYMEIRLEETRGTAIVFRGKSFESIKESEVFGGNVRVLKDGGWGFVSFSSLDDIREKASNALEYAKTVSKYTDSPVKLASVPVVVDEVNADIINDPRNIPLDRKVAIIKDYAGLILSQTESINTAVLSYFDTISKVNFVNSEGTALVQESLQLGLHASATAVKGDITQINAETFTSSNDFNTTLNRHEAIADMCKTSVKFLDAEVIKGGAYPVICAPLVTGVFIHEAFGHLSEGDNVFKNKELQKIMVLGREFGRPILNVYDSGLEKGKRGYMVYDSEGVRTEKTYLIKNGLLVGRLHTRETASAMNERPTGNARAIDYKFPPIPRMRNTAIEPGETSFDDIIKDIKLGIYAKKPQGGQTGGEMFTFTLSEAYMIRDGKIAEPVRAVTLSGNLFQTLKNIDCVSNDLRIESGGCGKHGQYPLPVGYGGPSIRINNVVVGGK